MSENTREETHRIGFVLSLAKALHNYGYPAHRLEDTLSQVARRLELHAQFFSTPTSIFAAFGRESAQNTHLIRIEPGGVDLGKLADLHEIAAAVVGGAMDPQTGRDEISRVVEGQRYSDLATLVAFGVVSGGAARLLGGGANEVAIGVLIGALVGLLSLGAQRFPNGSRLFEPAAALTAAFVATVAATWLPELSIRLATMAGIIVLIPGLTLTVAMSELSMNQLVSGTARLAGAVAVFLTIGFGVAIGNHFAVSIVGAVTGGVPRALPGWTLMAALLLSPLAFVVLFRAQARDTLWIVVAGIVGFAGAKVGAAELGPELGVFVGAFAVGATGNLFGKILDRPPQILVVPGILMLVPGSFGFLSLTSLMDRDVMLGVETAFTTVLVAVALAAGLLLANAVFPPRGIGPRT